MIDGREWRIGNAGFVGEGIAAEDSTATHVFLGVDADAVAWFELEDEIRPDARQTLESLRSLGLATALVSGDNRVAVDSVARALDIDDRHYECTPADKLAIIEAAQQRGERVV